MNVIIPFFFFGYESHLYFETFRNGDYNASSHASVTLSHARFSLFHPFPFSLFRVQLHFFKMIFWRAPPTEVDRTQCFKEAPRNPISRLTKSRRSRVRQRQKDPPLPDCSVNKGRALITPPNILSCQTRHGPHVCSHYPSSQSQPTSWPTLLWSPHELSPPDDTCTTEAHFFRWRCG